MELYTPPVYKTQVKVVYEGSPHEFEEAVNALLKEDWSLNGHMIYQRGMYVQLLTKYKEV